MSYLLDDEQKQFATQARRFLEKRYSGDAMRGFLENSGTYDAGLWQDACEMGWTGVAVEEDFGGLGRNLRMSAVLAEETGRVTGAAPFFTAGIVAAEALRRYGSADQKAQFLPELASGALKAAIMLDRSVPAVVGDKASLTITHVVGGAFADLLLVRTAAGVGLLDLRGEQGGVATVERRIQSGMDNSRGVADLACTNVPFAMLPNATGQQWQQLLAAQAVFNAWEQIGGAQWCLDTTSAYANERIAFGQKIGAFQAIKHGLAEIFVAIELARGNARAALIALENDEDDLFLKAGAACLSATQAYDLATTEGMEYHGGIGSTWEHDLHLHYRRARSLALEAGNRFFWEDGVTAALEASLLSSRSK